MPDTGAPWNIPYVAGTDLVADWPTDSQTLAEAIADGLDAAAFAQSAATRNVDTAITATSYTTSNLSLSYTPTDAANILVVEASGWVHVEQTTLQVRDVHGFLRLYDVTNAAALVGAEEVKIGTYHPDDQPAPLNATYAPFFIRGRVTAGSTSARTYQLEMKAITNQSITLEAATCTAILTVSEIAP